MSTNGPVPVQACAFRISRLAADGAVVLGTTGMVKDDKPIMKWTAKPAMEAGTEMVPKSGCGAPLIAFKDYDRIKRWDVTLDLGDFDPEKKELLAGGQLITAPSSLGRTFADGETALNSTVLQSPALANFTPQDYGRVVSGTGIPGGTSIVRVVSATEVILSNPATAAGSGVSVTLGALAAYTIGYQAAELLSVPSPNGVAVEFWQKLIVRGTGFQGDAPYPTMGSPTELPSAWLRYGFFRCYLFPGDIGAENKESADMYTGWAIENPNFGTGPEHDWTTTAAPGGPAVDTTKTFNAMADIGLPSPLQAGYQTTS